MLLIISHNFSERLTVEAEMSQYVTGIVSFQADRNITMIQGFDLDTNGYGGHITAMGGGIGVQNVTLVFQSQFGQKIDFNLEVYGR